MRMGMAGVMREKTERACKKKGEEEDGVVALCRRNCLRRDKKKVGSFRLAWLGWLDMEN